MALYTDIFGRLDWLTTRVKRLCCAVDKNTAAIAAAEVANPCYLEIVLSDITAAPDRNLADWNADTDWSTPFTAYVEVGNTIRLYGGSNVYLPTLFNSNTSLISINDGCGAITGLDNAVFGDCINLAYVNLPAATSIPVEAFLNCTSLTYFSAPLVTNINNAGFNGCTALTTVIFPNLLTIGEAAFSACSSLFTITAPNLTSIGPTVFQGCISLTSISFPKVTSVSSPNAFAGCTSLITANLPAATFIGASAFQTCAALITINLNSVINLGGTPGDDGVFDSLTNLITLTVPVVQETIDGGDPDGDIVYLLTYNPGLTVNYI